MGAIIMKTLDEERFASIRAYINALNKIVFEEQ